MFQNFNKYFHKKKRRFFNLNNSKSNLYNSFKLFIDAQKSQFSKFIIPNWYKKIYEVIPHIFYSFKLLKLCTDIC